jgi:hypothetical protein
VKKVDIKDYIAGSYTQQYQYKSFTPSKINLEWVWTDPQLNTLLSEANRKLGELNAFLLQVHLKADTLWPSQKMMSELFKKDTDTIELHLKNVYKERELHERSTTEYFSVVQKEGKRTITCTLK